MGNSTDVSGTVTHVMTAIAQTEETGDLLDWRLEPRAGDLRRSSRD